MPEGVSLSHLGKRRGRRPPPHPPPLAGEEKKKRGEEMEELSHFAGAASAVLE